MADPITVKIKYDGGEVDAGLDSTKGKLGETGEAAAGMGADWGNMSQKILAAKAVVDTAVATISKLAAAVRETADEIERQAGIMNRFGGNVDDAARRTGGLITQIDLMGARQKTLRAGLELTDDQFATVAVAATEMAAATGGDALQALNKLTRSISTGATGALRQYGINLQGVTELADLQAGALAGLDEQYGDVSASADTLAGRMAVADNAMADLWTEVIRGHTLVPQLTTEWDKLTGSMDKTRAAANRVMTAGEEFGVVWSATLEFLTREIRQFLEDLGDVASFVSTIFSDGFDQAERALRVQAGIRDQQRRDELGFFDLLIQRSNDAEQQLQQQAVAQEAAMGGAVSRAGSRGGGGGGGGMAGLVRELTRIQDLGLAVQEDLDSVTLIVDKEAERLEMMRLQNDERERQVALQEQVTAVTDETIEAQRALAGIIRAVAKGEENLSKAIQAQLVAALDALGQRQVNEGTAKVIEGAAMTIMGSPQGPAMTGVGFGQIAFGAGLTAAGAPASPSVPAASAQPAPGGGGGGGGGDTTIVQNFNAPMDPEEMGLANRRSERAARRASFGGRA